MKHTDTEATQATIVPGEMKVTMLDKSGYVVTTKDAILVFDYYADPEKALEKLLKNHPYGPVLFFVSGYGDNLSPEEAKKEKEYKLKHHIHNEPRYEREETDPESIKKHEGGTKRGAEWHFNHDMFNLAQNRERIFVMSDDINPEAIRTDVNIAWIHAGGIISDRLPAGIQVKAYRTNEQGVSFLVTLKDGRTIYYGGEYSDWANEPDMKLVRESFNGFVTSLHHLEEDVKAVTLMFFPVNPAMGESCYQQARLLMENVNVKYFVPMQFGQDVKDACDFDQYLPDQTTGLPLHSPSQTIELNPDGIKNVPD